MMRLAYGLLYLQRIYFTSFNCKYNG